MTTSSAKKVVLVDDHPLLAAALATELAKRGVRAEAATPLTDGETVLSEIAAAKPDAVVLDLGLPIAGGGQALLPAVVALGMPVMVLTGETDRWQWAQATQNGAHAVVSKMETLEDIVDAIERTADRRDVRPGEWSSLGARLDERHTEHYRAVQALTTLSPREEVVLAGLMDGYSVQRLAERDYVSVQTVRSQVKAVLRKLGVTSQLEAVALANGVGWTATTRTT